MTKAQRHHFRRSCIHRDKSRNHSTFSNFAVAIEMTTLETTTLVPTETTNKGLYSDAKTLKKYFSVLPWQLLNIYFTWVATFASLSTTSFMQKYCVHLRQDHHQIPGMAGGWYVQLLAVYTGRKKRIIWTIWTDEKCIHEYIYYIICYMFCFSFCWESKYH